MLYIALHFKETMPYGKFQTQETVVHFNFTYTVEHSPQ